MTNSLVSIITPVYNGEKYLEETLLSVFSQTYKHWELIVVDDGSTTDACAKICHQYSNKLKYIRQENRGLSAARNRGIQEARGEYIAFIDQDDLWLPEKLEKQVLFYQSLISREIQAGLVYTKLFNMDDSGKIFGESSYKQSGNLYNDLIYSNRVGTPSSVMAHKSIFNETGYFDESLKSYSDWEYWIRISRKYEIHCLDEFLARYRYSESSLSKNIKLMASDVEKVVEMIIENDKELLKKNNEATKNFRRFHRHEIAKAWKEEACDNLLNKSHDARSFRQSIIQDYGKYRPLLGFKMLIYFALSFISISLCRRLMKIRRPT